MAELQVINIGTSPNDGEGDPLRTAFSKVNNNFANIWTTGFNTQKSLTNGNTVQTIFEYPANLFTQATFQINSSQSSTTDSQNIVINASINGSADAVKFTAHSTIFHGNAITNYSMDVVGGNVTLYANPFVNDEITHFITYQVTFDPLVSGIPLILNQDPNAMIGTESTDSIITTEG